MARGIVNYSIRNRDLIKLIENDPNGFATVGAVWFNSKTQPEMDFVIVSRNDLENEHVIVQRNGVAVQPIEMHKTQAPQNVNANPKMQDLPDLESD